MHDMAFPHLSGCWDPWRWEAGWRMKRAEDGRIATSEGVFGDWWNWGGLKREATIESCCSTGDYCE